MDAGDRKFWTPDLVYSLCLFLAAAAAVGAALGVHGALAGPYGAWDALFFVTFGIFTISVGYPHPGFGHVSFDRVAQVASILVLGPVDAAWINGLASLLYPWHRLAGGERPRRVLTAAFNNAGLMSLVVLSCGLLYGYLGGPLPLQSIDLRAAGLLLLLALSMQFLNDLGMMVVLYLRGLDPKSLFHAFTTAIELLSVLVAVVVAIAYTTLPRPYLVLLLVVLGAGMLVIKQYAVMRQRLEALVEERTEELRQQAVEFERQATHDKLTRLPNRRYADDFVERQLELVQRSHQVVTIALADVDSFKAINDRHSHGVGDEVLRRVARILSERCRKTDVVARYGGEEFLLCFPDTDARFATQICEQIRFAVEQADWSDASGPANGPLAVTISIGLAEARAGTRRTTVLNEADQRLYQAKKGGRNRVVSPA